MNEIELASTINTVDNRTLSASAEYRITTAVPESTRRVYAGDWKRFTEWAVRSGRTALPISPQTVAEYANHLADLGRAPSTIERALAAISSAHKNAGAARPDMTLARAVLRSHRREQAEAGRSVRKAAPVTVTTLRAMVASTSPATPAGMRDRAIVVLGFALGARRSELAGLDLADITDVADGFMVTIRTSKTDKQSTGREVAVPYGSNPDTCPVRTFRAWRDALAAAGRVSGPAFVRVDRHGVLGRAASGRGSDDGRLTGQAVALIVNRLATAAGLDPAAAWSGHSLRRGFATATYAAGADPLRIARHGGWKDGSPTLLGYVEEVERWQANPLVGVGL